MSKHCPGCFTHPVRPTIGCPGCGHEDLERQLAEERRNEQKRIVVALRRIADELSFCPGSDNSYQRAEQTRYLADTIDQGRL